MCQCINFSMDLKTPINAILTPFYKRSFAYYTMSVRYPIILTQLIDALVRNKEEIIKECGQQSQEELKAVIGEISKLKYEVQTNKPLIPLVSGAPDAKYYNDYLSLQSIDQGHPSFFNSVWLHVECYAYRKLREIFEMTKHLNSYDFFKTQKQEAYRQAMPAMEKAGNYVLNLIKNQSDTTQLVEDCISLLKMNLWGNRCDLSISLGESKSPTDDPTACIKDLDEFILSDQSYEVWRCLADTTPISVTVDIILDNAGYELFTDLCLADFIISKNYAKVVRFYVKTIPWFISDTIRSDIDWLLKEMSKNSHCTFKTLADRWRKYFDNRDWVIIQDDFWIYPVDFSRMASVKPDLYKQLTKAKLIIFKGDLNYRKLFGEKNWPRNTPVDEALRGFHPSKLCVLRTIKCDMVCGLQLGVADKLDEKDSKWMETGQYGVIQFSEKITPASR